MQMSTNNAKRKSKQQSFYADPMVYKFYTYFALANYSWN